MDKLTVPLSYEAKYRRAITILLTREIPRDLSFDNAADWMEKTAALSENPYFIAEAERIARALLKDIFILNSLGWRAIAQKTIGGSRIIPHLNDLTGMYLKQALDFERIIVTEDIATIPRRVAKIIEAKMESMDRDSISLRRAHLMLHKSLLSILNQKITQLVRLDPGRVNSMISKARSEDLGLPCFIWNTLKDQVVRPSHLKMDGVVVMWNHLPMPELLLGQDTSFGRYVPGGIFGCRCTAIPVISIDALFETEHSRVRVYFNNIIQHMVKATLMKIIVGETYALVN